MSRWELSTWAEVAQIASVFVAVLIAVFVFVGSKRSASSTEKILQETRQLAHSSRRSSLIAEIQGARIGEHLQRLRYEIVHTFPEDSTVLLRILYSNPAAQLPNKWDRDQLSRGLVEGLYEDLNLRYGDANFTHCCRDLADFAVASRRVGAEGRYRIRDVLIERLADASPYEARELRSILRLETLDIAAAVVDDIHLVPEEARASVVWEICSAFRGECNRRTPGADLNDLGSDLAAFLDRVSNRCSELRSMNSWNDQSLPCFINELVFSFVHTCAHGVPYTTEHHLGKYVLPLCAELLRSVQPLGPGEVTPARVLDGAVSLLDQHLREPWAGTFVAERERILAADPEMARQPWF